MSSEIAIKVESLSKCYQIYDKPNDRLKQFIFPKLQQVIGKKTSQYYKAFWALNDVSFEVKKGETVGIIGQNGSGKSTLLQMVCGTLTPSSGSIKTYGRIAALLELGSGFNPEFTGHDNIYMNAAILGLSQEEVHAKFDEIVAFADIGEFIEQPVKTYSSGMLVRLAFAVIAHVDADVLIIDEALAVGDTIFVQKCNHFIREFAKKGTLCFVSHNMQAVLDLCDKAIWLKNGTIISNGIAKEVVRNYNAYVHQEINRNTSIYISKEKPNESKNKPYPELDHRKEIIENSNLKYKINLQSFDLNSSFWGAGGAEIIDIEIFDSEGNLKRLIEDCGVICIRVNCLSKKYLESPIIGITLRNIRGVEIISDNSYLTYYKTSPPKISENIRFYADFKFFLPYLPTGEYTIGAAIADGTQNKFIQHHRRDDALRFNVISSHCIHGIFSMPLEECSISVV